MSQGQNAHPSPKDKTSTQVPRTKRPPKSQGQNVHPNPKDKTSTQVPRTKRPPKSQGQNVHPSPKDKTSTQVPRTKRPPTFHCRPRPPQQPPILPALKLHEDQTAF
ncbi:early nodulin-75 [Biomphalaria glabrata]|nr:early nodulin-75 [Biomphalaria glabrata]